MHILAMLISLSGMAERLAGLPFPVRRDLLIPVRRAEACLREFVFTKVYDLCLPLPREAYIALSVSLTDEVDSNDERLAVSFRALAMVLAAMLEQADRFTCHDSGGLVRPSFSSRAGVGCTGLRRRIASCLPLRTGIAVRGKSREPPATGGNETSDRSVRARQNTALPLQCQ